MSRPSVHRRIVKLTVLTAFVGGVWLLVHEMPWLENALDLDVSVIAALVLAAALLALVCPAELFRQSRPIDRWTVRGLLAVGLLCTSTAGISYANRVHAVPLPSERWVVAEKTHRPAGPQSVEHWKLRLTHADESHWIHVSQAEWDSIAQGQTYELMVLAGRLQLRFVDPPSR